MIEVWKFRTNTTINNPNNGNVRANAVDLTQATTLAIAHKSDGGTDMSAKIAALVVGDVFTMHGATDDTQWVQYSVTAPAVMQTTWSELAVSARASHDPTFADAALVSFTASFGGTPGGRTLATLAEAKAHLQITDDARDAEVQAMLALASGIVLDYIGWRADPSWDEVTAPDVVRAATLRAVVHNWEHRGDDSDDTAFWTILRELLMRTRDPALA